MTENIFWILIILIIYPLILYPLTLCIIAPFYIKKRSSDIDDEKNFSPMVSFIITAYNEEKVIYDKVMNLLSLDYDKDKLEVIIVSDGSTDSTNTIVKNIQRNAKENYPTIKLHEVAKRKGKTNAQNEAVKIASGEIIAFSDANSKWNKDALRLIINRFKDNSIGYVCGRLQYINCEKNITSKSESTYWNFDLLIRKMESQIASIVGGNGAIYAIRKSSYVELPPLISHDGYMPGKMVVNGMKAKFEDKAIATEKAGQNSRDEFRRKVRMSRGLPWKKYMDIKKFNFFKYGWFSYFYIGHKFIKYLFYIMHPAVFILNLILAINSTTYLLIFIFQCLFYILALIGAVTKTRNKIIYFPYYYSMTIVAQGYAVIKTLLGLSKPFWEKAESTR